MIHIISDSSTLYSKEQGKAKGLDISPLCVTVNQKSYREFEEIKSSNLLTMIQEGKVPSSSQPPIGEKIDLYDQYKDEKVIDITMAQGLSGTYDTALMARDSCVHPENVTVFNSKTLCGPHRILVDEALKMAKNNESYESIMNMLNQSVDTEISFLIPFDFQFLLRGGRLSKTAAGIGGLLKLVVCMRKSEDGRVLEKHSVNRTLKKAVMSILDEFDKHMIDESYLFSISHAFNEDVALKIEAMLKEKYPSAKIVLHPLSPAFITQGGPGCCAVQTIKIVK